MAKAKSTPTDAGGVAAATDTPEPTRAYAVGTVPVRHDGRVYDVGHEIELTDAQAARLAGLLTPIPE